jgi:hypothetical protein
MNPSRVALVYAADGSVGSGYLINRSLVLTAGHVVRQAQAAEVWLCGTRRYHPAKIVWRSSDQLDAGLLRLETPPTDNLGMAPRFGRFGRHEAVDWECTGFPDAARVQKGHAILCEAVGAFGVITAGGGLVRGLLELTVHGWPRCPEGWEGLSGACVFAQCHAVGLMRELPPDFAGRRLTAVPMERILEACSGVLDEQELRGQAELAVIPTIGLNTRAGLPPARFAERPSALLVADRGVVPFQDVIRERELEALEGWCSADEVLTRVSPFSWGRW